MEQTVEVSGRIRTGNSPKYYNEKRDGLSMSITKINRGFDRLAEENITNRHDAERTRGEVKLANSRNLTTRLAKAVKKGFTALTSGTSARQKGFYLHPKDLPSTPPRASPLKKTKFKTPPPTPPRVSPNSGGGYNSRKLKKPTVLAKKPKKVKKVKKSIKK
jgi:hypothetical protein